MGNDLGFFEEAGVSGENLQTSHKKAHLTQGFHFESQCRFKHVTFLLWGSSTNQYTTVQPKNWLTTENLTCIVLWKKTFWRHKLFKCFRKYVLSRKWVFWKVTSSTLVLCSCASFSPGVNDTEEALTPTLSQTAKDIYVRRHTYCSPYTSVSAPVTIKLFHCEQESLLMSNFFVGYLSWFPLMSE